MGEAFTATEIDTIAGRVAAYFDSLNSPKLRNWCESVAKEYGYHIIRDIRLDDDCLRFYLEYPYRVVRPVVLIVAKYDELAMTPKEFVEYNKEGA